MIKFENTIPGIEEGSYMAKNKQNQEKKRKKSKKGIEGNPKLSGPNSPATE